MSRLEPILSPIASQTLTEWRTTLFSLVRSFGSPLYLLFPSEFRANIDAFRAVFHNWRIKGDVWYACKVNKTRAFLEVVSATGSGVDVASLQELRASLGYGIPGDHIGVSGPEKDRRLLALAIKQGCTIALDTISELRAVASLAETVQHEGRVKVLVRLSGFDLETTTREGHSHIVDHSRFGFALGEVPVLLGTLAQPALKDRIHLRGFSFHIDNHSVADRSLAIIRCLGLVQEARRNELDPGLINLGGGLPIQYVEPGVWQQFVATYVADRRRGALSTFRGRDFGIDTLDDGTVLEGLVYPHHILAAKDGALNAILSTPHAGQALGDLVREANVELVIEPGRSLLDQCGLSICRVRGTRRSSRGDALLMCDMNISHLWDQVIGSEFLVDPILIHQRDSNGIEQPFECHLVGNLCLESDVLAWRRIEFKGSPTPGDLLVFANTAGYQMDFIESRMHQLPLPARLIVYRTLLGLEWCLDDEFTTLDLPPSAYEEVSFHE